MDLFSKKAKFDQVRFSMDAIQFHANRYENGSVDTLAKQCHQYLMLERQRNEVKKDT